MNKIIIEKLDSKTFDNQVIIKIAELLSDEYPDEFKSLKKFFKDLNNYDEVILSCGSGISACVNSLALRELDIPHKIYIGSFSDWISYDDNEIKTGQE